MDPSFARAHESASPKLSFLILIEFLLDIDGSIDCHQSPCGCPTAVEDGDDVGGVSVSEPSDESAMAAGAPEAILEVTTDAAASSTGTDTKSSGQASSGEGHRTCLDHPQSWFRCRTKKLLSHRTSTMAFPTNLNISASTREPLTSSTVTSSPTLNCRERVP